MVAEIEHASSRLSAAHEEESNLSTALESINDELKSLRNELSNTFSIKAQVLNEISADDYLLTATTSHYAYAPHISHLEGSLETPLLFSPTLPPLSALSKEGHDDRNKHLSPFIDAVGLLTKTSPSSISANADESALETVNRGIMDVSNRIRERLYLSISDDNI